MQQKILLCYNIGLAGHSLFLFAVVHVYRDATILVRHDTMSVCRHLYLDIHWCTSAS